MKSNDSNPAIKLEGVSECFRVNFRVDGRNVFKNFKSLQGLSFEVPKGQILGVIGENGSGKTTLLRLLAGVLEPDAGVLKVNGTTASLLDVGAGLEPDFSGRENIENIVAIMEPDDDKRLVLVEQIIEFADLGDFIDVTVRQYSQGMQVRLGFAVAVFAEADVLLVDEVISVGDISFQNKSFRKITEYIRSNKTVVIASHDIPRIAPLCDSLILLSKGKIISAGNPQEVVDYYNQISGRKEAVGLCAAGDLRVVFNAGKLFVRYRGKTLTPYGGLTWVCDFYDYQEPSVDFEWGVETAGGSLLQVKGVSSRSNAVCRVFVRELDNENFNLGFDFDFSACKQECRRVEFSCILDAQMKHWAFIDRKGVVDGEIDETVCRKTIVASCPKQENPVCAVGSVDEGGAWLMFDSFASPQRLDYEIVGSDFKTLAVKSVSHVLESHTRHCQFKTNLMVFDSHKNVDEFLCARKHNFSIGNEELRFYFSKNSTMIHAREREISVGNGLDMVFFSQDKGKWFDSAYALWRLEKKDSHSVRIEFEWDGLGMFRAWIDFDFSTQHNVGMTLGMHNPDKIEVRDMQLRLNFRLPLSGVCCGGESIDFSQLDFSFFPADLPFKDCRVKTLELCGAEGQDSFYLSFNQEHLGGFFTVEEFESESSVTCITAIVQKIGDFSDGGAEIKGIFSLKAPEEEAASALKKQQDECSVHADNCEFKFIAGVMRIFNSDVELTDGMGLYSSTFNTRTKHWTDSRQASWKIEEYDSMRLTALCTMARSGMQQRWSFKLTENGLEWKVNAAARFDAAQLGRIQFALMLGDDYKKWFSDCRTGSFQQEEFTDSTRSWLQVYAGNDRVVGMRGTKKGVFWSSSVVLPEVVFERLDSVVTDAGCKVERISGFWNSWSLVFELDLEHISRFEKGQELFSGLIKIGT